MSSCGLGCKFSGESAPPLSNVTASVSDGTVGGRAVTDSENTQIIVALSRLQDDMQSVLARLNTLEARAMSRVRKMIFDISQFCGVLHSDWSERVD